jgi:hypothetical protein
MSNKKVCKNSLTLTSAKVDEKLLFPAFIKLFVDWIVTVGNRVDEILGTYGAAIERQSKNLSQFTNLPFSA